MQQLQPQLGAFISSFDEREKGERKIEKNIYFNNKFKRIIINIQTKMRFFERENIYINMLFQTYSLAS